MKNVTKLLFLLQLSSIKTLLDPRDYFSVNKKMCDKHVQIEASKNLQSNE